MKKKSKIILIVIISLLLLNSVTSLNFISVPSIINNTETSTPLYCSWNSSVDTINANISWYNSSIFYSETTTTLSYATLFENIVKRGETWMCKVILNNGTAIINANYSVVIKNGNPKNFKIYNISNTEDLGNSTVIYEDSSYTFYLNATDPEDDTIVYSTSINKPKPSTSVLNYTTGIFSWTPSSDSESLDYNITFLAFDEYDAVSSLSFLLDVVPVNDVPIVIGLSKQTATEDSYFNYTITASDEESNFPLTFEILNDSMIGLSIESISDTSARVYFTPDYADRGNKTITIKVNDSLNASIQEQFVIEVISINHVPNFTYIENSSGTQGGPFLMHLNASDLNNNDSLLISINPTNENCPNNSIWNSQFFQLNDSANNSYAIINVTNLTNEQVICRNVKLSVSDNKGAIYDYDMILNITNINDAPIIYQNSTNPSNTNNNKDIYNLTAYQNISFSYTINFTDPDLLTYQGDAVHISTNFTEFNITFNSVTGKINFTTNNIGTYNMYVEANDSYGNKTNKTLILEVKTYTFPTIVQISNKTINESELFSYTLNASGTGNITYFSNASNLFTIDSTTGLINFTPSQAQIGNHSIKVWVQDEIGGITNTTFNLEILNKNNPPVLGDFSNFNQVALVVNHTFYYKFLTTDDDLNLPNTYDYLTFWTNSSVIFSNNNFNTSTGVLFFTPSPSMIGNHSVVISVNDSKGLSVNKTINFTIYNVSIPPSIMNITPFGDNITHNINLSWISTTNFNGSTMMIISENTSLIFNHTTTNPENDETVNYTWLMNGDEVSTNYSFGYNFDFFSSREHHITLFVNDSHYGSSNFTWVVNVVNINRPVIFLNNPANYTIIGDTKVLNFLKTESPNGVFYDPDDDFNSNGIINENETNNLVFSYNQTGGIPDSLNILFEGVNAILTPLKTTLAAYTFTASDMLTNATTENVFFNLSLTNQNSNENNQNQQNSGGGGSGSSSSKPKTKDVYYQIEVDKILTMEIIALESSIMYENNTVIVPVIIKNNGNKTFYDINLSAYTSNKEVNMSFGKNYFSKILPNEEETTNLTVTSFRTQGKYEIEIKGMVTDPKFNDSAVVLIDSLQKENEKNNEIATKTMISFAKDLLSTNPKCLELNEMLKEIENDLNQKNYDTAQKKIQEVVTTCRYLTSEKTLFNEEPKNIYISMRKLRNNPMLFYTLIGVMMSSILGIIYSAYYTNRKMKV